VLAERCEARGGSRSAWGGAVESVFYRLTETGGGVIGGALELLEPGHTQRVPLEPRPIEVEALAVVARLRTQLVHPEGLALAHGRWRSARAARITGVMRLATEDPCLSVERPAVAFQPALVLAPPFGLHCTSLSRGLVIPLDPLEPRFPRGQLVLGRL
jgi:hypothetical protein